MEQPPFVPEYNKPEAPGIFMNFDNTVSIYHIVRSGDDFDQVVQDLFGLLREAQDKFPDWPRTLYLDIEGHTDQHGDFEPDFFELQQEFFFAVMAPFLTAFDLPLTGALVNPSPQRNDVPDRLVVRAPEDGNQ